MGDRLLHYTGALDDLRQEHLALTEQVTDHIHAVHQRPLDDLERVIELQAGLLGVFDDPGIDALHERVADPFRDRRVAPGKVFLALLASLAGELIGNLEKALRGVVATVADHVIDPLTKLGRQLFVQAQLASIHNAHAQTGADCVIEEDCVDSLPNHVVAAK